MKVTRKKTTYGTSTAVIRDDSTLLVAKLTTSYRLENTPKDIAVAMLYSELLLAGTKTKSKEEISNTLDLIGGSIAVNFIDGSPNYNLAVIASKQDQFLKVLKEIWAESTFSDIERKKKVKSFTSLLTLQLEDAKARAEANLRNSLYKVNSIYHAVHPNEISKVLPIIKREDIINLHHKILTHEFKVTIGGNEKTVSAFENFLTKTIKPTNLNQEKPSLDVAENTKPKKLMSEDIPSKQNLELSLGSFLPISINHTDFPAFLFGLSVLGKWGGFAGRLMSTVREKEGLTYGIYARTEGMTKERSGHWRIMTFFAPKDTAKGVSSTLREVRSIVQTGITEDEYQRFKIILKTSETLLSDSLQRLVATVHEQELKGFTFSEYLEWRQELYQVKRKDINQALKNYLNPKNLSLSIAGPIKKINLKEIEALF